VDYSLAPEYPFPAAFNECYDVCRWVFERAPAWDADPKRISLGGHSAGGNLTAAVALKANQTKDFRLCLQFMDYAALEISYKVPEKPESESGPVPYERGRMFTLCYTGGDEKIADNPFCSPLLAPDEMLKGLPEALVISGGLDGLRFQDETYAMRLAAAGIKVTVKRFLNSKHGFVVHRDDEWEEAKKLIIQVLRWAGRE
jgi:acetyl esterase